MKDMTSGNPLKLLVMFSIPLLCGNVFQQLYLLFQNIQTAFVALITTERRGEPGFNNLFHCKSSAILHQKQEINVKNMF